MGRSTRILVPSDPSAVPHARDSVLAHVGAWGIRLDVEMSEAVKLVASELITNAVVHVGGAISLSVYYDDGYLLLVVHDSSPDLPVRQPALTVDEGGHGLALVGHFASHHGWEHTGRGKKVWAEFEVRGAKP
ncbi:ATP-binding protein [Streptomyces coffeae]|uniref:ATP-binding protein n=1 Tax=Streptomyces coffeae TaxID=621382 RepID=A0ABS1NJ21_9ACTN|nr:ATP-binding protein [Streptomyces coffeae]MBL1099929.1 ATP-binding protein [Streptomyces coffeae]